MARVAGEDSNTVHTPVGHHLASDSLGMAQAASLVGTRPDQGAARITDAGIDRVSETVRRHHCLSIAMVTHFLKV